MFTNLKNKLIEEVKASPSKFQQFATAAQAAVSSASSSESTATTNATNEHFFSITEEDTPQNSPSKPLKLPAGSIRGRSTTQNSNNGSGAIPRTRKLSNSSMTSDISFRLPTWDAGSSYHLQSDLDESGSELGDAASTTAKLDVITKEQLFDAYRKSLDRYHKYRCRYTDLAKKYKDLERDSAKARSVLVETQEKAIRRINELREQCSLEQQAKAHLEEALRIEMDDMQCKMQAYQTKLKLLGENPDNIAIALASGNNEQLIDLSTESTKPTETSSIAFNDVTDNDEDTKKRLQHFEKILRERDEEIVELNNKLDLLRKQEEENVLFLAQTKAAIHSELENKESEVKKLNETVKQLQAELQHVIKKEQGVAIDELNEVKDKLKQTQMAKQELEAKIIATEHIVQEMRAKHDEKAENYKNIEEQLEQQARESETKLQELKQQNQQLNDMVTRYQQNEISLAEVDNELNRTKNENDILKARLTENECKLQETERQYNERLQALQNLQDEFNGKEEMLKQALDESQQLQQQLHQEKVLLEEQKQTSLQLENKLKIINEQISNTESETITNLKSELERVSVELNANQEQLSAKEKEMKSLVKKTTKSEKQQESHLTQLQKQNEEIEKFKCELIQQESIIEALREASQRREQEMNAEKGELKTQISSILNEISQMEEQMRVVQDSHQVLDNEKQNLENRIESLQHQTQTTQQDSKRWQEMLNETEEKLKVCEVKLQMVESAHTQMAERNCLLEENTHRLEKLLVEKETQQAKSEEALISELRLKLQTTENSLQKLNEKMQEVLDENSRLHNNQELNDHDQRTLQDRYDTLEKEKACLEDNKQCLQQELNGLKTELIKEQQKNQQIQKDILQHQHKFEQLLKDLEKKEAEVEEEKRLKEKTQQEHQNLQDQFNITENNLLEITKLLEEKQHTLQNNEEKLTEMESKQQMQLNEIERRTKEQVENYEMQLLEKEKELLLLKGQLVSEQEDKNLELEKLKEELIMLRGEKESLRQELLENNSKFSMFLANQQESDLIKKDLQENVKHLEEHKENSEILIQTFIEKEKQMMQELKTLRLRKGEELQELQHLKEVYLTEQQDKGKLLEEVRNLKLQLEELHEDCAKKMEKIEELQENVSKHSSEAAKEQITVENEYLNKEVKPHGEEKDKNKTLDSQELKEKYKSLQCELYVLKENSEKHRGEIEDREKNIQELKSQNNLLSSDLENVKTELERQLQHIKYITEQDDTVQKLLLSTQNKLKDLEIKHMHVIQEFEAHKEQENQQNQKESRQADSLKNDLECSDPEVNDLSKEMEIKQQGAEEIQAKNIELKEHDPKMNSIQTNSFESSNTNKISKNSQNSEHLRKINETLQRELEELNRTSTLEISTLRQEVEDLQSTNKQMANRIMDLEVLRAGLQAQKLFGIVDNSTLQNDNNSNAGNTSDASNYVEKQELENKLKRIMAEVQDVSNRNLFLEQKCENYLILEQSNERLKLQNAKLSRQLDETLVSMQHNEGVAANTEFEYLKNIMFQYLTGSANGNNETLVKVISAVLKFSPQQTQVALEKEHQRRSLINKIL